MHLRRYTLKKSQDFHAALSDYLWPCTTTEGRESSLSTNTVSASSETERKKPEDVKQPPLEYTVILATLPYRTCLEDHLLG